MKKLLAISMLTLACVTANAKLSPVIEKFVQLDKRPLVSDGFSTHNKAIYAICDKGGQTVMYRAIKIRRLYNGNSQAELTQFNGNTVHVYMNDCKVMYFN